MEIKRYQWKGRWTGVNVFTVTCFTSELKVDYESQRALFRHLINCGVSGIDVNGHTGEGETLTMEERKKIIKIALEEAQGRIPVCTGVHAHHTEEGIEQAKEMEKTGVDALMILSPTIYLFDARHAPEYGIQYHKAIAKAVNIPVVMHQVYGTVDEYPTDAFVRMFKEIDNLVAVKMANGYETLWYKLEADLRALRAVGRDNISLFPAAMPLQTFRWSDGTFTGYANFGCKQLVALFKALKQGNLEEAIAIDEQIYPMLGVLYGDAEAMVSLMPRYKECTRLAGLIPSSTVRPPKLPLNDQVKKRLREQMIKAKLLPAEK